MHSGVRVALSTAVAATKGDDTAASQGTASSAQDRAINLLAANGGNLAITFSYPLYYHTIGAGRGTFLWNSYTRLAGDVAAFGGNSQTTVKGSDLSANVEIAVGEVRTNLLSYQDKFDVLGYAKVSGVYGTRKFADSLAANAPRAFAHVQGGAGLRIGDLLTIYLTWNHYPHRVPGTGAVFTFAVGK